MMNLPRRKKLSGSLFIGNLEKLQFFEVTLKM